VLVSLENLMTFPFVKDAVEASEMTLHGLWNNISEGTLEQYDPSLQRFDLTR
jgi:carbonic anhydrase